MEASFAKLGIRHSEVDGDLVGHPADDCDDPLSPVSEVFDVTSLEASPALPNVFTCDVEDWEQAYFRTDTVTERCYANTIRCLELLAEHDVKGTFFVQSLVAEQWPAVVRAIQSAGHDVQSHSHSHQLVHVMGPHAFREDLRKSIDILQNVTGQPIRGFRAPCFSIGRNEAWAFDIMGELGITFDSSLFPVPMRRYGLLCEPGYSIVSGASAAGTELEELPVSVVRQGRLRIPVGGGGYLRLFPKRWLVSAMRRVNREGRPFVLYTHPYEFAPDEFEHIKGRVPPIKRWMQRAFRSTVPGKLSALFQMGRFSTMPEVLAHCRARVQGMPKGGNMPHSLQHDQGTRNNMESVKGSSC